MGPVAEISAPRREAGAGLAARACEAVFGAAALVVGLSVLAPVPVLGLATLGYAVLAEARVARTGRLRDALFGAPFAARAAVVVTFAWLLLLVPRALAARAREARLVDPSSAAFVSWSIVAGATLLVAVVIFASACLQGGRVRDFFRPRPRTLVAALVAGDAWTRAREALWIVFATRAMPLLAEGARALLVGAAWLLAPTALLIVASRVPGAVGALAGAAGAGLLALALLVGPFAQGRAALSGTIKDGLDVRASLAAIARAPLAALSATLVTLVLATPLHLLKIEPVPPGAAWVPSLAFVALGLPSRALVGWALARSSLRAAPAHVALRIGARIAASVAALAYVGIAILSQYTSWRGAPSLFEQHVLMVPTPFLPF